VLFIKKRILRIFPLLWLATFLSILISGKKVNLLSDFFLNLSGLFGFIKWDTYYATGAWSIGNELVFYSFFPILLFLLKKCIPLFFTISVLLFVVFIFFSYNVLDSSVTLTSQWKNYINPLNQSFYFLCGIIIGRIFKHKELRSIYSVLLILIGTITILLLPVKGDLIHLVTGTNRLVFTISSILLCVGFYKLKLKFPNLINKTLTLIGESSYSIYLLHPIIFDLIKQNFKLPLSIRLISTVLTTLILSVLIYQYFEKYLIKKSV